MNRTNDVLPTEPRTHGPQPVAQLTKAGGWLRPRLLALIGIRDGLSHRAESRRQLLALARVYAASHPAYAAGLRAAAADQDGPAHAGAPRRTGLDAGYRID